MVAYYVNSNAPFPPSLQTYAIAAQQIGAIVHRKLRFHSKHPYIPGNFAFTRAKHRQGLVEDLRDYLSTILHEARESVSMNDFTRIVLYRPMVEEAGNACSLLIQCDSSPESKNVMHETEEFFNCQGDVFINSCVFR
jgi:hypothetical protein